MNLFQILHNHISCYGGYGYPKRLFVEFIIKSEIHRELSTNLIASKNSFFDILILFSIFNFLSTLSMTRSTGTLVKEILRRMRQGRSYPTNLFEITH